MSGGVRGAGLGGEFDHHLANLGILYKRCHLLPGAATRPGVLTGQLAGACVRMLRVCMCALVLIKPKLLCLKFISSSGFNLCI